MKYLYLFLFALTISSCNRAKYIEFNGTLTGIGDGAFVIKDMQGNQLLAAMVSGGTFHAKTLLPKPGFYDLFITPDLETDYKKKIYEVYLEGGTYTINADKDKLYLYPTIKSDSKTQNELSDFYSSSFPQIYAISEKEDSVSDMLYGKNTPVSMGTPEYADLQKQYAAVFAQANAIQAKTLGDYVSKNPQNDIEAFLLAQINYKKDASVFNAIYQKFTPEQKNTNDGKAEGDELAQLMKLAPGAAAPKITGKTLDGKVFDPKAVSGKKVVLVEFWKASSQVCELNHLKLLKDFTYLLTNKDFTVISVSMDAKRDDWVNAIQQQRLPWIQVSDLQGLSSLNMTNWAVSTIPTYDLVDGNWHMIKRDIDFANISDTVEAALKK